MALQGTLTTADTVEHTEAYLKVIETNIHWLDKRAKVVAAIWHDQEARDGETPARPIKTFAWAIRKEAQMTEDPENENEQIEDILAFDDIFGTDKLNPEDSNPVGCVYGFIKTRTEGDVDLSTWTNV